MWIYSHIHILLLCPARTSVSEVYSVGLDKCFCFFVQKLEDSDGLSSSMMPLLDLDDCSLMCFGLVVVVYPLFFHGIRVHKNEFGEKPAENYLTKNVNAEMMRTRCSSGRNPKVSNFCLHLYHACSIDFMYILTLLYTHVRN